MATNHQLVKSRPLNILCISEHYSPLIGGTITYVKNICKTLARLGQNVFLITYTPDEKTFPPLRWVKIDNYNVYNLGLPSNLDHNTRAARRNFCKELDKIIVHQILSLKADIVHVLYGHYVTGIFNNHIIHIPVFWTVHNFPPAEYSPLSTTPISSLNVLLTTIYFYVVKQINISRFQKYKVTNIIAVSEHVKNHLIQNYIPDGKIIVIPNGVNVDIFTPQLNVKRSRPNHFPTILTVAPISQHKGLHVLLTASVEIRKYYPNVHIINIGSIKEKKYKNKLDDYIQKYKLGPNWTFITNEICRDELLDFFNGCDIYVQPSLQEGFCLTFLEAASCGKPLVGTNTGAISEILKITDNESPCPPGDSKCLAEKITEAISKTITSPHNTTTQHNIISNKYSWTIVVSRLISLYEDKLQKID
ncbi:MAG: glycosyltransferase family 4 protein [bacterium]|nr:glycosyltransferase family 4 protein [bacterium]